MPQAGQDYASNDEVKVYKDEGENEDEKRSENLNEEKLGLVTETEEGKSSDIEGQECFPRDEKSTVLLNGVKIPDLFLKEQLPFSYPFFHHYPYPPPSPLVSPNKLFPPPPGLGFLMYGGGGEGLTSPPPAHMGIPALHIDLKSGLSRPPLYGLAPTSTSPLYPSSVSNSADFPQLTSSQGSFQSPYSTPSLAASPLSWFSNPAIFSHNFPFNYPSTLYSRQSSSQLSPFSESVDQSRNTAQSSSNHSNTDLQAQRPRSPKLFNSSEKRRCYIKKPLNAFMLFMKEMRQKVIEECTLKESAAINQILGRKWHALERSEQAKYYEMAKREKEVHMRMHPGWSARDNYATHTKKKKKRETPDSPNNRKIRLQYMEATSTISDSPARPGGFISNGSRPHLETLKSAMS